MTLEDLKKFDLIYLGTPYTKYPDGHESAWREAISVLGRLLDLKIKVYSPIVQGHPLSSVYGIDPHDVEFWVRFNRPLIDKSDAFLIVTMESWEISSGLKHEVGIFLEQGKPIFYLDPNDLKVTIAPALRAARELGAA